MTTHATGSRSSTGKSIRTTLARNARPRLAKDTAEHHQSSQNMPTTDSLISVTDNLVTSFYFLFISFLSRSVIGVCVKNLKIYNRINIRPKDGNKIKKNNKKNALILRTLFLTLSSLHTR